MSMSLEYTLMSLFRYNNIQSKLGYLIKFHAKFSSFQTVSWAIEWYNVNTELVCDGTMDEVTEWKIAVISYESVWN